MNVKPQRKKLHSLNRTGNEIWNLEKEIKQQTVLLKLVKAKKKSYNILHPPGFIIKFDPKNQKKILQQFIDWIYMLVI